jgi:DNA-binding MarR family transcriptional regulator
MPNTEWLDEVEDAAWRGLRRVHLLAFAEIARDLQREAGLSDPDYEVLSNLSESADCMRFGDLVATTRWSTSRLSHHLDRMERRGLVSRSTAESDGRGSDVTLTPVGRRTLEAVAPLHVRSVRRHIFDPLTPRQVAQLADIASAIVGAVDDLD